MKRSDRQGFPPSWELSTINDVAVYVQRGKSPKYIDESDLPVVNQRCVRWDQVQAEHLKFIHPDQWEDWDEIRTLQIGDILWNSTGTGTIGRASVFRGLAGYSRVVADSHITVIRLGEYLPEILHSWIRSPTIQNRIEDMQSGSTNQVELSKAEVLATPLPVPPLGEQRRIAAKLETLLARVDACRERLDRIPAILKRFRRSVLSAATSGKLTEGWRQEKGLPPWSYELANDVCEKVQSGGTPKNGFIEKPGIPFLKVYNIVDQKIAFDYRPQFVPAAVHAGVLKKSQARPGDVLMNIVGPPLGKVAILPSTFPEWNLNQAITLFRPSSRIITGWLYVLLCSGRNVNAIRHETKGSAGQKNISLTQCRQFEFPVPSVEEQREIVGRTDSLLAYADRVEEAVLAARHRTVNLVSALLAKAFRGELVPQDPNDEPASVLLERIRAERAASSPTPRRSKDGRRARTGRKPEVAMLNRTEIDEKHLSNILRERGPLTSEALWSTSQLGIDDFYDQLKDEEARGLLVERRGDSTTASRMLEAAA